MELRGIGIGIGIGIAGLLVVGCGVGWFEEKVSVSVFLLKL